MPHRPLLILMLCLAWLAPGLAGAQPAPNGSVPPPPPAVAEAAAELERIRAALQPIEASLSREDLSDAALVDVRDRVEPLRARLEQAIASVQPQLDTANQRLSELGEAPKEGAPPESPETTREREAQTAAVQSIDEVMRRARVLLVQATQIADSANERRRSRFTAQLFERQPSLLSPELWIATAEGLPKDISSLRTILGDATERVVTRSNATTIAVVGVALLVAVLLWGPGRTWANRLGQRVAVQQVPAHRLRRSAHALWIIVVTVLAPTLAAIILFYGLDVSGFLTTQLRPLAHALVFAVAFVAFVDGLAKGILSPEKQSWRLPVMADDLAQNIRTQADVVSTVYGLGLIVSSLNLVALTSAEATLVTDGLFAVANAVTFGIALRVLRTTPGEGEDAPDLNPVLGIFRVLVWIAIALIMVSAVAGYIAFAKFLAHQVMWVSIVGSLLYLLNALTDDLFTIGFAGEGRVSLWIHETIGLKRRSIELIGILLSGLIRLVLYGTAALAILAPWGIGSYDAFGWLRALAFGFSLGGFRVSISAIFAALAILIIGVFVTRAVQRWLETRFLPKTSIEAGLQNSIRTSVGYLGTILAVVFSLGFIGLNLQNVALVAGALSVGIGFGLQSIVNNFVSGLILLAERPVKVGDWVQLGTAEGNIRKISVRATEIELFDRSTLIVPNADLISQQVTNKTLANPLGRVLISMGVSFESDPRMVHDVMLQAAMEHPDVFRDPAPSVMFSAFGELALNFTLVAFVSSPRNVGPVQSDILFAIHKAFKDAGIEIPPPPRDVNARLAEGIDALTDVLGHIPATPPSPKAP